MAPTSKNHKGEPPRLSVPQDGKKPLLVVKDDEGQPVMDLPFYLAWHKGTGTYYVGGSKPREYLRTKDRKLAIFRFRDFVNSQDPEMVTIRKSPPPKINDEPLEYSKEHNAYLIDPDKAEKDGMIAIDLSERITKPEIKAPSTDFWHAVREVALSDPERFRKETGLRIVDEKPKPSVPLSIILQTYLGKRKQPCDEEIKKVKLYWEFFVKAVQPARTVRDVTSELVAKWEDAAYTPYYDSGSPKTLHHRFEYVVRLFNWAIKKKVDIEECERVRRDIISHKSELPDLRNPNPQPISIEDFHALLAIADERWTAILLTALNLCFYGVDIRTLPKSAIDFENGWVIFDRAKTGQTTRVGVLWDRTIKALQEYLSSSNHDSEWVFITQYGTPYTAHGLRNTFRMLRVNAPLSGKVELAHIRDGAYTAAIRGGASETMAKILAGHKIGGMSDPYIKSDPGMVKEATDAIEHYYFRK